MSCSAQNTHKLLTPATDSLGFVLQAPSSGPNKGIWYVHSAFAAMHLRAQVRRDYRPDGEQYAVTGITEVLQGCTANTSNPIPPQNNHSVNSICMKTDTLNKMVQFVWEHEERHLNAMLAAASDTFDLRSALEAMIRSTRSELLENVLYESRHTENEIAKHGKDAHLHNTINFSHWYYFPKDTEWRWRTIGLKN
jgi:hypothetical protein